MTEYYELQNPEYAGEQQRKYLDRLAELRKLKPKVRITFLYSTRCPHCRLVKPILEKYVQRHPEISLTELNVESKETYTNLLEATLKGELEVPVAVINDRFIVKGDKDFLARLTYAIKLAENTPPTREEEAKWLLKK
ncbi:hypothetical protein DRO69_01480 [Candidatus Bathyarchaeota archaeon]|nr:MAG: hypothetical protein DRO69_01480 [Candidatus Bathyarchaeota archaeon]